MVGELGEGNLSRRSGMARKAVGRGRRRSGGRRAPRHCARPDGARRGDARRAQGRRYATRDPRAKERKKYGSDRGRPVVAGGVEDHVHLVLQLKPDRSVSQTLARLKAVSSKWLNESGRLAGRFEWQRGYGAFSVRRSDLVSLQRYVAGQREHHRRESYRDELVRFLDEHGVDYEERFLLG